MRTRPGRADFGELSRAAGLAGLALVLAWGCSEGGRFFAGHSESHGAPRKPPGGAASRGGSPPSPGPQARPASPWDVRPGVKPRDWRYVVVHHSGTAEGSAAAFDRYHRRVKGFDDLGYHFVIGNGHGQPDGSVAASGRWRDQRAGAHAGVREYNERGIGICLVGDFRESVPTPRQMAALRRLLEFVMKRFRIAASNVVRHRDLVPTRCPGRSFPWPVVEPRPVGSKREEARRILNRW